MQAKIQGIWEECTINEVLYMPGAVTLFSECVMSRKGFTIVRNNKKTIFYEPNGQQGPTAVPHDGLFAMNFRDIKTTALLCKAKLWHQRFAHINMKYIQQTINNDAALGINPQDLKDNFNCDHCHFGKEARKPFPAILEKRNTNPGEMLHSDLSGKMPSSSLGGANYFMIIKDDCTGFRAVYFLLSKTQAKSSVQDFITFIETQTGNKVKRFRSDNGTEYVNEALSQYFNSKGIRHETTAPYCPESNGRAEREMRTIKDTARAMLSDYDLPNFLWGEAVATSVYVHNRVLNKMSPDKTAFERIFNQKPNLKHLHVFGCKAFAQNPKEIRRVWDAKSKLHIFVGYDGLSQKFRLYDSINHRIVIARNVSFVEEGFETFVKIKMALTTNDEVDCILTEDKKADDSCNPPKVETISPPQTQSNMVITVQTQEGN